jgi:hypothetical protein
MDALMKLSREAQVILVATVLFVIISFFDWQQVSVGPFTAGKSLWHGFGVITALVAIVLLVWEVGRAIDFKIELGSLTPGMVSAGLELLLVVFTIIVFLDWSDYRHWPEWIGLVLALLIGVFGFLRAKNEGVEMPTMPKNISMGTGSSTGGSTMSGSGSPEPPPPPSSDEATGPSGSTEA